MSGLMVVIVGGGIGGLTAAIALQAAGIDTQIYEQAPELCEVGAGVGLWGNAVRALDALGLAGDVLALGAGSVGSGVKRPDGQWLLRQPKDVMARRWGTGIVP